MVDPNKINKSKGGPKGHGLKNLSQIEINFENIKELFDETDILDTFEEMEVMILGLTLIGKNKSCQ